MCPLRRKRLVGWCSVVVGWGGRAGERGGREGGERGERGGFVMCGGFL